MECVVVHWVSGRVRLRVQEIHGDDELGTALAGWIAKRDGVANCRVNTLCASVVICYDEVATEFPDHLQAAIRELSGEELEQPERQPTLPVVQRDPGSAWPTLTPEFLERPETPLWPPGGSLGPPQTLNSR